jgi:serine/threonine-protein kinase SRPK3
VALKIAVSGFTDEDVAKHERDITRSLETNPSHDGFHFVRIMLDNFEATGPDGNKHICLVYEPMREPLWLLQQRMPNGKILAPLLKVYLGIFLQALDYLILNVTSFTQVSSKGRLSS